MTVGVITVLSLHSEYKTMWVGSKHPPVLPDFQPPDEGGPIFVLHGSGLQGLLPDVLKS